LRLDQRRDRRRQRGIHLGFGGVGDLDQSLQEPGDAGEADLFVLPVQQIDDLLVGTQLQGAGIALN
jgi:hypothetical protein